MLRFKGVLLVLTGTWSVYGICVDDRWHAVQFPIGSRRFCMASMQKKLLSFIKGVRFTNTARIENVTY